MTKRTILISVCLAVAAFGVMRQSDAGALRRMSQRISDGHTIAWARHITGQDVNDLTSWDDFNSVAVIPGGAGVRYEDEVWVVTTRTIDGNDYRFIEQFTPLDWGDDPNYCWFVDCAGEGVTYQPGQAEIAEVPGTPAVPATYKYTWISENGTIWGIPVTDQTILTLDAGGVAVDEGGGIVSVPCAGHPFVAGDVLRLSGTTNYSATTYTLAAGTTASRLHFTSGFTAETFTGAEVPQKVIAGLSSGAGRMVQDSSGNLYYGHVWDVVNSTYVTKIETDGTLVYDFLNPTWPVDVAQGTCLGLAITPDDAYLYIWIFVQGPTDRGFMEKYDLATGNLVWQSIKTWPQYHIAIDINGNAYAAVITGDTVKFASADGTQTTFADSLGSYGVLVDDVLGILVSYGYNTESNNLWVSDLTDLSNIAKANVGGAALNIETGCVVSDGQYIYVLAGLAGSTLYKYDKNLTSFGSVAGPTYGRGLYIDLWGNLVVVNQDAVAGQDDVLWFYDTDLTYLGKAEGLYTNTLATWASAVGGAWVQGDVYFNGELGTPEGPSIPGVPGVPESWGTSDVNALDLAEVCVYADAVPRGSFTMDGNDILGFTEADYSVVIAGLNYYSIYESFPIVGGTQYGPTQTQKAQITDVRLDFFETLGANIGVSIENSSMIVFSEDDFATQLDPFSGPKIVLFPRGQSREPVIFIWNWEPTPTCLRGLYINANIFFPP